MKIIVGLGNPGKKYEFTRHNVGWWLLDHLADVWRFDRWRHEGSSLVADGALDGERIRLLKPQIFMNLSGDALRPYARRLEWSGLSNLLVVVDDVAIPIGTLRVRAAGSAGGHNGLKSIEATLGTKGYARLRIGIFPGKAATPIGDLADFVLDRFETEERDAITALFPRLLEVTTIWVRDGIQRAMNRPPAPKPATDE
ncbi:MAG: aminoacyl-tRNA hydrolase [Gemmatimonadaceae bacterium]